jgi:hypothetical protein
MDKNSEYFVFKLAFGATSTTNALVSDSNLKENHAYAIVSDGGSGYYATGFIE